MADEVQDVDPLQENAVQQQLPENGALDAILLQHHQLLDIKKEMYGIILESQDMKEKLSTLMIPYCISRNIPPPAEPVFRTNAAELMMMPVVASVRTVEPSVPEALANDIVLDLIGSFLSAPDLRNARVVCKKWADAFHRSLVLRKSIMISSSQNAQADILLARKRVGENVHISTLAVINFSVAEPIVKSVVSAFGPTISGVILDDCFPTLSSMTWIFKRLQSLELIDFKCPILEDTPVSPVSFLDHILNTEPQMSFKTVKVLNWEDVRAIKSTIFLSSRFPNLKTLKMTCSENGGSGLYQFGAKPWPSLKNLHIAAPTKGFLSPILTALGKQSIAISKLKILNVGRTLRDLRSIELFIRKSARHLKILSINKKEDMRQVAVPTNFQLFNGDFCNLEIVKHDFSLAEMVRLAQDLAPKLTSINASDCSIQCWFDFFCGVIRDLVSDKPNHNVTSLYLGYVESICLRKFGVIFPALTTLELPRTEINEEAMRVIFKFFPNLQKLVIRECSKETVATSFRYAEIGDSAMLGLEKSELDTLIKSNVPITKEKLEELRTRPYIGDLRELRSLKIEPFGFYYPSDLFFEHGINNLPHLESFISPLVASELIPDSRVSDIKNLFKERSPMVLVNTLCTGHQHIQLIWKIPSDDEYQKYAL